MDWRAALRTYALVQAPLTNLLASYTPTGGSAEKAIFIDDRPQGSPIPALLFTIPGGDRSQHLKGFNLQASRVQIDSYGATSKVAWAVSDAALATLVGPFVQSGHNFSRADVALDQRSLAERVGTITVFRVSMDLIFHHAEIEEGS